MELTPSLRAYFAADSAYLADYQAKVRAVAAALDDPEDRATLARFATEGVAAERAMMAEYGFTSSEPPPRVHRLERPWPVELAEILPCFTVYAAEVPLPFYANARFQEESATMARMVAKYRARYPALAPAMDEAIARATAYQYAFLAAYPRD